MMTVHAAKGLEFDTVFITGMEEDLFPFKAMDPKRGDDVEEERRLAYVAVTRARARLWIFHAERRMVFGATKYGMPSRFLADLPKEVVTQQKTETMRSSQGRFIDRTAGARSAPRPLRARRACRGPIHRRAPAAGSSGRGWPRRRRSARPVSASSSETTTRLARLLCGAPRRSTSRLLAGSAQGRRSSTRASGWAWCSRWTAHPTRPRR
jgi:DNA helicase-2/ATP-dependent DNA helicase PcrA